ncbi:MAG: esterase/lipase family protein [Nocardioides sp.]
MRRLALFAAALVAGSLLTAPLSTASEGTQYPVPYNFLPYALVGGAQTDAPGSNDWKCKPTDRHPRPVVLVHGTFGNQSTNWQTYAPLLANNGYCVFALTYGQDPNNIPVTDKLGGMTRMQDSAEELKKFVAKVRRATGAAKLDIVGHSQGTLMPNYYVKFLGGAKFVKRYVSLAPLWHGTQVAGTASIFAPAFGADAEATPFCVACGQFASGSKFMKRMREGGVAVDGVVYTNIMTEYDELVVPYTSGREKGMRNIVVQDHCDTDFAEHFQIAADPVAAGFVLNALDPTHPRPVPCTVVAPFVGPAPTP